LEVVGDLEEFEVIQTALGSFESSSNRFHFSPDIDEGLGVSRSWDLGIFEVGQHEIKFRAHQEVHTLLEIPRVSPPMFFSQGISFGYDFGFGLGELEDISEFFFKEKDFLYGGSPVDLDHLEEEEMFSFVPSILH
jgi:hypothetical protein